MKILWFKRRDYPIKRDEYGRSLRQQAFDFFTKGYRPAQIFKGGLVPATSMKTLLRYFEDWKKKKHRTSRSILIKMMKSNPEFTEKYVQMMADYVEVPPEDILARIQRPWGIEQLTRGELPDKKLLRIQSEAENRLEAALRLIYLGEQIFHNSPEQVKQLIWDIITLKNDTRLVIQKTEGQVLIRKERLPKRVS